MDKILSIVIPTYNMEKYLNNTLSSMLIDRNMELLDVIVVNDGSKDSSLSIAREFEQRYPETFHVIDKPNGNYGSCINRGLKEAKGKYIKILDADDSYDTKSLSTLVETLLSINVDMVLTDYVIVNKDRKQTSKHTRSQLSKNAIIPADSLWTSAVTDIIEMHEITYRTENLRNIKYHQTEGIAFTDQEWKLMPLMTIKSVYYMPIPIYRYLVGREGQSVDVSRAARLQPQGDKTMFVQIEFFNQCSAISTSLRQYMVAHLSQNLKYTYRTYLITAYKAFTGNEIIEFDNKLKDINPLLYDSINSEIVHPKIPLRFIKAWRKNKYKVTLSIKLYRTCIYPILRRLHIG